MEDDKELHPLSANPGLLCPIALSVGIQLVGKQNQYFLRKK